MKYILIILFLIFISLESWATNLDHKQSNALEVDTGENGIYILISGKEAMNIYNYLIKNQDNQTMFLISEGGMGKHHISTPVIHCQKTDPTLYDPVKKENDPDLYSCDIMISRDGRVVR